MKYLYVLKSAACSIFLYICLGSIPVYLAAVHYSTLGEFYPTINYCSWFTALVVVAAFLYFLGLETVFNILLGGLYIFFIANIVWAVMPNSFRCPSNYQYLLIEDDHYVQDEAFVQSTCTETIADFIKNGYVVNPRYGLLNDDGYGKYSWRKCKVQGIHDGSFYERWVNDYVGWEFFRSVDYNCTKTPLSFDWLFFTFLIFEVVFELLPTVPFLLLIEFLRLLWRQRHVGKWYTIVWPSSHSTWVYFFNWSDNSSQRALEKVSIILFLIVCVYNVFYMSHF